MPEAMADELKVAYMQLGQPPVAVRSSAEDLPLPCASFAGQQDTYLNLFPMPSESSPRYQASKTDLGNGCNGFGERI